MSQRRPYVYRASDRVLATLLLNGPLTTEQLARETGEHPARINGWLHDLKARRQVRLIDAGRHRTSRGYKCGRWQLVPEGETDVQET